MEHRKIAEKIVINYLGIDPGLSGGLALIGKDGVLWAEDMPTITVKSGKKNQRFIDLVALRTLIVGALFVVSRLSRSMYSLRRYRPCRARA